MNNTNKIYTAQDIVNNTIIRSINDISKRSRANGVLCGLGIIMCSIGMLSVSEYADRRIAKLERNIKELEEGE